MANVVKATFMKYSFLWIKFKLSEDVKAPNMKYSFLWYEIINNRDFMSEVFKSTLMEYTFHEQLVSEVENY